VFLHDSLGCVETWCDFAARLAKAVRLDAMIYDRRSTGHTPHRDAPDAVLATVAPFMADALARLPTR
jgi:hypothetical protein